MIRTAPDGYAYDLGIFYIENNKPIPPEPYSPYTGRRSVAEDILYRYMRSNGYEPDQDIRYPFDCLEVGEVVWTPRAFTKSMQQALRRYVGQPANTTQRFEFRTGQHFIGVWRVA